MILGFFTSKFTSKNLMSIRVSTHTNFGEVDKKYGFSQFGDPKLEQFPKSREIPNLFFDFSSRVCLKPRTPSAFPPFFCRSLGALS